MTTTLKLSGVDPSIIRELSGIYKPFGKAFKELISNAYDADADVVAVKLSDDFATLEIHDDGAGMTPFELREDFAKLGGSRKRLVTGVTAKGRARIGHKGIGFLAVARYCNAMEVVSTTTRRHTGTLNGDFKGKTIDVAGLIKIPIPRTLVCPRLIIKSLIVTSEIGKTRLKAVDYLIDAKGILSLHRRVRGRHLSFEIKYEVDCRDLELTAVLNFEYLLGLENRTDLNEIRDFCRLEIRELNQLDPGIARHYTKVTLKGLKEFVIRDLKAPRKGGWVRNIESLSGIERLIWQIQRCAPIQYSLPESMMHLLGQPSLNSELKSLEKLVFSGPGIHNLELSRPVWSIDATDASNVVMLPIDINSAGVRAKGYVLGHSEAITPAEYRGIAIRVRNVQIGTPGFFGLEEKLSGQNKGILSQITGELNVLEGLDSTDALNPGRDSFYEENPHYKLLRTIIAGNGETLNGLLGEVVKAMVNRTQVLSALQTCLARANQYRSTLLKLSFAINHYGTNGDRRLRQFFSEEKHCANGLSKRKDHERLPGPRLGGFYVDTTLSGESDQAVDFESKTIHLNLANDRWNDQIFVLGSHYRVVPKVGNENDPLCEIDTSTKEFYVNWTHPLRQQLGDAAFLKSSVAWKLAYHACGQDIESMMDLALKILAYNGA
jgi:hypothetical protein